MGLDAHLWTSRKGLAWVPVAGVDLAGYQIVGLVSDGSHVLLSATGPSGAILLVSSGVTG